MATRYDRLVHIQNLASRRGPLVPRLGLAVMGLLFFSVGCGPRWELNPEAGERLAADKNQPMLIYFKSWDSPLHRNMQIQVFDHAAVKNEMKDTVNVELEFAFFPDHRKRYGVQRSQFALMTDPQGRRVANLIDLNPVPTPEAFLEWLRSAKAAARAAPSLSPSK